MPTRPLEGDPTTTIEKNDGLQAHGQLGTTWITPRRNLHFSLFRHVDDPFQDDGVPRQPAQLVDVQPCQPAQYFFLYLRGILLDDLGPFLRSQSGREDPFRVVDVDVLGCVRGRDGLV